MQWISLFYIPLLLAQIVANSHTYDIDTYNCLNYSMDLRDLLDMYGFNSSVAVGYMDDGTYHAWNEVNGLHISGQTGGFVSYNHTGYWENGFIPLNN